MLKNIQLKVILIFLIIGNVIIISIGYINYNNIEKNMSKTEIEINGYNTEINKCMQNQKKITICAVTAYTGMCLLVRNIRNRKNNRTSNTINK